jgi:hypothetical protein
MAGLKCSVNFDDADLPVNSWKTVCALKAPTNQALQVLKANFFPNGVSGDAEHLDFRLTRITAASGTGTATTPIKLDNRLSTTPQATARIDFSAEPTEDGTAPYIYPGRCHPQGALMMEVIFDDAFIKEGTELALQIKVPSGGASTTDARGHIIYEE